MQENNLVIIIIFFFGVGGPPIDFLNIFSYKYNFKTKFWTFLRHSSKRNKLITYFAIWL